MPSEWNKIVLTLLVACFGAFVAVKLRVRIGALVGAMLFAGVWSAVTGLGEFPWIGRQISQLLAGAAIGVVVTRDKLGVLKRFLGPALFMIAGLLALNVAMGAFMHYAAGLDWITALFAAVPGGIADIAVISADSGADVSQVAMYQLMRMLVMLVLFPLIIPRIGAQEEYERNKTSSEVEHPEEKVFPNTAYTLCLALAGGALGFVSGIPGGALMGSLVFVASLQVITGRARAGRPIRRIAQALSGAFIGCRLTLEVLLGIVRNWLMILIFLLFYLCYCLLLGYGLHRIFGVKLATSLFCCAPTGASDMALVAAELGLPSSIEIAALQSVRLVCAVAFFPQLIVLFASG